MKITHTTTGASVSITDALAHPIRALAHVGPIRAYESLSGWHLVSIYGRPMYACQSAQEAIRTARRIIASRVF